jgi:integrase
MLDFKLVKRIVDSADPRTPRGLRDRAILAIFFGGGLRRGEVRNLRIGDVRHTRGGTTFLYLRSTKARRDAEQALPTWAATIVNELVKVRTRSGAGPSEYLFVGYTGRGGAKQTDRPISTVAIYELFKAYCAKAGAGEFVTPHSARATAITKLLADGVPHRKVQEFSRHSSVQMVELYDKRRLGVEDNPGKDLDYEE